MKKLVFLLLQVIVVAIASLLPRPTTAGPNANGALVVHCRDDVAFTATDVCPHYPLPSGCALLNTTSTSPARETWVWVVGAFLDTASPRIACVRFGLSYSMDGFSEWYPCGPVVQETADPGWPYGGSGTQVFYSPPVTDRLSKLYVFSIGWSMDGDTFGTAGYHGPTAQFSDDANPPNVDECARFGFVGYNIPGHNECPQDPAAIDGKIAVTRLDGFHPNPVIGQTRIDFTLARGGWARLELFDPTGRATALLADGVRPAGPGSIGWNATGLKSGVYFARLTTAEGSTSKKLIVLE